MKYRAKFSYFPLTVVCVDKVDLQKRVINLKGFFKENMIKKSTYRLYKRYVDFNLDKVSTVLTEIDEQNDDKSIFMVSTF